MRCLDRKPRPATWCITLVTFLGASLASGDARAGQGVGDIRTLPAPTGSLPVGRVTMHWSDASRQEPAALGGGAREIVVDVWYPSEAAAGARAPYVDPAAFENAQSAEFLRRLLRGAYDPIREGRVRTHATQGAAFNRSLRRAPVLIFSHGGGEARELYGAQLEDLASHGYVVAAISHTHEAVLTILRDGRHATLAPKRWPRPAGEVPGPPRLEEPTPDRVRWWAADIRLVVDQLTKMNDARPAPAPFAGRLDLDRIGAFGHSAGGQAAAHACQIEPRLRACLNQDGLNAFAPYYLDDRGWGMNQRFMLIVRNMPREEPSPEDLAAVKMTLAQARELVDKLHARQDACLRNTGGAFRVLMEAATTTHADFGDLPFLQATTPQEADVRARILDAVRRVTRSFFDDALKGESSPILQGRSLPPFIEAVQRFEPAKARPSK
jgi:predicted dienelactone hydrolase